MIIKGDKVVIEFDNPWVESFPAEYLINPLINRAFKKEIQNIWIVEETYVFSVLIKHIQRFNDKAYISTIYLITLNDLRNNKIDKILC